MKPTYTTQNVIMILIDDLRGSHMFSDDFIIFSVFSGCSPKKHLKVPEFCRYDFGYLCLFLKSAGTFLHYLRWTCSFARKIWITYKLAHMTYHQNSSNQPDDPMGSTESPRTPKDPPSTPFGPLNIPLDPIGPLISPELPYK